MPMRPKAPRVVGLCCAATLLVAGRWELAARVGTGASPPAVPEPDELIVPQGQVLFIEIQDTVSSGQSRPGDAFQATVIEPVLIGRSLAVPIGSVLTGRVVEAVPATKVRGRARLNVRFTNVELPSGRELPITASYQAAAKGLTPTEGVGSASGPEVTLPAGKTLHVSLAAPVTVAAGG